MPITLMVGRKLVSVDRVEQIAQEDPTNLENAVDIYNSLRKSGLLRPRPRYTSVAVGPVDTPPADTPTE